MSEPDLDATTASIRVGIDSTWWPDDELRYDEAHAALDALVARVRDLEARRDRGCSICFEARERMHEAEDKAEAAEARVAQLETELDRTLTSLQHTFGREEKNRARIAQLETALAMYADETNWEDETPPPSVNTAGYTIFTWAGRMELPWSEARAALVSAGQGEDHV